VLEGPIPSLELRQGLSKVLVEATVKVTNTFTTLRRL
jgi:hypothetical protein